MRTENGKLESEIEGYTTGAPIRQNENENTEEKSSFRDKVVLVYRNITLEPCLFMFIVSAMIIGIATQNLNLEKACRVNLNFTEEICDSLKAQDIDSENIYERETQKLLASALFWRTYISAALPCITALFAGSFSDKTGHRKFFIMITVFGQLLIGINNMFHTYFFYQIRMEFLVLSEAIIEGLTGGWCLCFLTAFAFVSSITTDDDRTFRLGLISFSVTLAFPVGLGISGILLKTFGYYGCYGLTTGIQTLNFLYLFFLVKDPKRNDEQKKHDRQGIGHLMRQFFKLSNVKETVSVIVRKAPNNRRVRLCVLLGVISLLFGPLYGDMSVLYMSTRYRFNWDEVKFSIFQAINFFTHAVGTLFSIMVLSKHLHWHDSLLGITSTISKIAAYFVYCFAPNDKIFYLAPMVDILNGTALLAMRSLITKHVEANEQGKVNSMVALVENLMPLIYVPVYTRVYSATMEVLPGAAFLVGAVVTLPALLVLVWFYYDHRKSIRKSNKVPVSPDNL